MCLAPLLPCYYTDVAGNEIDNSSLEQAGHLDANDIVALIATGLQIVRGCIKDTCLIECAG